MGNLSHSAATQQHSLIISLPLLLFLGDPASLSSLLANHSAALLDPGDQAGCVKSLRKGQQPKPVATRCCRALEQGWPGRMAGFRLWCKSWWRSQEVHEKVVHGLPKEIRRNLIPA